MLLDTCLGYGFRSKCRLLNVTEWSFAVKLTSILGDIKQFGNENPILGGGFLSATATLGQKQRSTIGMREQSDVHQYLVAQHVHVQFVGHISDQLHEQLIFVQCGQIDAIGYHIATTGRTMRLENEV